MSTDPDTQKRLATAQALVEELARADYSAAAARFAESLRAMGLDGLLKGTWKQLEAQMGPFQGQEAIQAGDLHGAPAVYVTTRFEKASVDLAVSFTGEGQVAGMNVLPPNSAIAVEPEYNPPDYARVDSFHEVEIIVGEGGAWPLPGTLTLPAGDGPFPAAVLVHGSGPNDRDETLGPNKPFRDLAWGLASQGIAVLRYEKRTREHAKKFTPEIIARLTLQGEVIEDALLAAELLRRRPEVDPRRIFIISPSLGGLMAPRIGQQEPTLAGLVIMAGITRSMEDTILDQFTYLYHLGGELSESQREHLEKLATQAARVKDPDFSDQVPASELPLGVHPAYWLDLRGYRPAEVAAGLAMPVLVLQGGRDYQVTAAQDFAGWAAGLAGKDNAALKLYPDLNHLFMAGSGPSNPQEYEQPGHMNREVVDEIARWMKGW